MAGHRLHIPPGERYARLVVIEEVDPIRSGRSGQLCRRFSLRCDCGNITVAWLIHLRTGNTRSCGCLQREHAIRAGKQKLEHGHARKDAHSAIYARWCAMIARCENPNNKKFPDYGGRGIAVCERWRASFAAFLDDMGEPPDGLTLDRIDVNGNYEPGNCRWATALEQRHNRRDSRPS